MARQKTRADWLPDWRKQIVAILACGPSLNQQDVDRLKGRARVIAINEAWRLAPWSDVLYACDAKWWKKRGPKPDEFAGLRVGLTECDVPDVLVEKAKKRMWSSKRGVVATGSNSGFQALQLAVQTGGDPILLLGFDMTVRAGLHWHGKHPQGLNNPTPSLCEKWRRAFELAAPFVIDARVINCTPASALECFPKMPVEEALARSRVGAGGCKAPRRSGLRGRAVEGAAV